MSTDNPDDNFFSRWSRRKAQVRTGQAPAAEPAAQPTAPKPAPSPAAPVARTGGATAAPPSAPAPNAKTPPNANAANAANAAEPPPALTLDDVARLTRDADFSPFVGRQVPAQVRNAAMKKLFTDPHYNVMDGLDIYIDDYSKPSPLSAAMMAKMVGAQFLKLVDDPNEAKPAAAPATLPTAEAAAPASAQAQTEAQTQTEADPAAVAPTAQADTAAAAQANTAPDTPTGATPAQPKAQDDHADLQLQPDHAPEPQSPGRGAG
jgi:hypothetical protein